MADDKASEEANIRALDAYMAEPGHGYTHPHNVALFAHAAEQRVGLIAKWVSDMEASALWTVDFVDGKVGPHG